MSARTPIRPLRMLGLGAATIVVLGVALVGWRTIASIPIRTVVVHGAGQAAEEDLMALARIPADTALMTVSPTLVADRIRRHPWVLAATVSRLPTGRISIRVTEREPVLLVLSASGDPDYYLDETGHRMPYAPGRAWPVPVLTGLSEPYHPVTPVRNAAVRELARTLPEIDADTDALLSEFHVGRRGDIELVTTVGPTGRTLSVRLGDHGFDERLGRLRAFWDQVVLARPGVRYAWIDLRFDSQIVTSETS